MRFQKEINIFAKDAILKRFQTNETNFSVVKGKIEALISESEILELQNSKVTMYSKLVDVKLTVDGLEQTYTDITSKYDAVSGKYTDLDAKVAEYKSGVDGMSQNLSQVQTNLRDNYSTTATMNATIQAKIDGLSSTISQTYATGSDVQQKLASADATAKGYADAAKQEAVDTAQASTKELLKSYATVTKTQSMIDQKATSIESTVSSTVSYIKIVEEFSAGESKDHSSMCINGSFMADGESIKIYNAKHVTSGGHLVFDSDGSTVAYLSSSAKRYKNHLSNMTLDEAEKILDIPVVWFNYKEGYLAEDDQMNGKPVPGMYAEDVAKYYPVGAYNNEEGLVENWNERMIIPAMLKLLQNLYKRIS